MEALRIRVREVLTGAIAQVGLEIEITDDLSLIESGLLDSMSIITVVQELQDAFDIDIDFADVTLDNFDSLEVLIPFIAERSADG